ncbi:hypothetical protein BD311DRAFT_673539 [Dichomitus squalens]|uniref:Amine oxidase domain-containing protein n=1 Tax=Dichomitus squalens TaxID=114155 RepID=A0A4Q9M9C1_9APHY|nr:hypothetical protein BD311DRAFT_673539 [Dichomitus squalens]
MILDTLSVPYEILEANNRIGGRIYTYRFNGEAGRNAPIDDPARYDYVDIGAMRFPNIPFMKRVFDLFEELGMTEENRMLVPYQYSAANTFELFNGFRHSSADSAPEDFDIFGVSETKGGAVPDAFVAQGADTVAAEVFLPYRDAFEKLPFPEAWKLLTAEDPYSTRGYLLAKKDYPETVVEWLETFESATGLYNNAFVESTMDAMDFGSSSATTDAGIRGKDLDYPWYCIDGGADHLTTRMVNRIDTKPITGTRVTKIERTESGEMKVVYRTHGKYLMTYSQVICTVPLGCLAAIDIPKDDLSYMQRLAIRSLNYDTSTKIALKFESRWWEDTKVMGEGRTIKGGISSTDIPIRTCVYPSYGFHATGKVPGVMLASYTWAQDAQRLGGLAQGKGTEADGLLVELTLNNLSHLHGVPREKFGKLVDHYAYNWHNDENARGAFALFGPGQFGQPTRNNSMFASMKAPAADGKLHVAGEATSVHHAWVLGALNSAWRAVYNALGQLDPEEAVEKRKLLVDRWGIPDEETTKMLDHLAVLAQYKAI